MRILKAVMVSLLMMGGLAATSLVAVTVMATPAQASRTCAGGPIANPGEGYCATINTDNTWYGSYTGFTGLTNLSGGQAWCAQQPASGGEFPASNYNYSAAAPGTGASAGWSGADEVGFSYSLGIAQAYGVDDTGAGGEPSASGTTAEGTKLAYDYLFYGDAVSTASGATSGAVNYATDLIDEAHNTNGASGGLHFTTSTPSSPPTIGSGTSTMVTVAWTGHVAAGYTRITANISGGYWDTAGDPTSTGVYLNVAGQTTLGWTPTSSSVSISYSGTAPLLSMPWFTPTTNSSAQDITGPTTFGSVSTGSFTIAAATPNTASVTVVKTGNDPKLSVAGAVFSVVGPSPSTAVVGTLTTNATGKTGTVSGLVPGDTYTVEETTPPSGYQPAASQTFVGAATQTKSLSFVDTADHSNLTIQKVSSATNAGLAGAVFSVYETSGGSYSKQIVGPGPNGDFVSQATGFVTDSNNALKTLTPGSPYQITEVQPPPGFALPAVNFQDVTLPAGQTVAIVFSDKNSGAISTSATPSVDLSGTIKDKATLTGLSANAGGDIHFTVYGPFATASAITASSCTGTPIFTSSTITVHGPGSYTMSDSYTPTAVGIFAWKASYSGDANNASLTGTCASASEQSAVFNITTQATPLASIPPLATQAPPKSPVPDTISDNAIVTGVVPTGATTVFKAYGPLTVTSPSTCTAKDNVFTSAAYPVTSAGTINSGSYSPLQPGTYDWVNILSTAKGTVLAQGACGAPGETSQVISLSTQATPAALTHSQIEDSAVLSGDIPTGSTIVFSLYNSCTAAPIWSSAAEPAALGSVNGIYATGVATAGQYWWVATVSQPGDTVPIAQGPCGGANSAEYTDVLNITTAATPVAVDGTGISDVATVTGIIPPKSSIVFNVYAQSDKACKTALDSTQPMDVTKAGKYTSSPAWVGPAGDYQWADEIFVNGSTTPLATIGCGVTAEESIISPPSPSPSPTPTPAPLAPAPVPVTG